MECSEEKENVRKNPINVIQDINITNANLPNNNKTLVNVYERGCGKPKKKSC